MSHEHETPVSRDSEMQDAPAQGAQASAPAPAPAPAPAAAGVEDVLQLFTKTELGIGGPETDETQTDADPKPDSQRAESESGIDKPDEQMEGLVLESETKVYPLNKNLPPALRQKILEDNANFYPPGPWVTDSSANQVGLNTADVFELRGADVNKRMLPGGLDSGHRVKTIVSFPGGTVGKHLELSLEEALSRDKETPAQNQQKGNQKGNQGNQKGKGSKKTAVDAPLDECVKIKFHTDTQTPHIEISTQDTDTGNVISTRIFADEFTTSPGQNFDSFQVEDISKEAANASSHDAGINHVYKMADLENTTVIRVRISLASRSAFRVWEGILESSLDYIRDYPTDSVRDKLIIGLGKETDIAFFFSCKRTQGAVTQWETKLKNYFSTLLKLAQMFGNFWFYRLQCMSAGILGGKYAVDRIELPKVDFLVPRWLVREWIVKETTSLDGEVSYSDLKPYSWAPLEFPTSYPNVNQAAFLLKMSVAEEAARQQRNLRELLQSGDDKWFRAKFTALRGKNPHYSVEIYLGLRERMVETGTKLPPAGTRIVIEVNRNGHESSDQTDLATLRGRVIDVESDANIVCVCGIEGRPLQCANSGTDYPVSVSYIVDDLPYRRQLQAIMDVQSIRLKKEGPDLKAIVLGCREPAGKTDILKQRTTPDQRKVFLDVVNNEFPNKPTPMQVQAAMHTCESETGTTVIVGPPGCGKTVTALSIGVAHARIGHRVMYAAPTNSAVYTLLDKFTSHNEALPADKKFSDDSWVLFTGAHHKIGQARRLQHEQLRADAEDFAELHDMYQAHLREARMLEHSPRYTQTLGYKLQQRIHVWGSDPKYDEGDEKLYTIARDFTVVRGKLPELKGDEQKKARTHIDALEYQLAIAFLRGVKFCFCTLSTSAHPLLLESGTWDECIIDEAARETRAGIATILGALRDRILHATLSGDYMQGDGTVAGNDTNVGYKYLTRNVFEELAQVTANRTDDATPTGVFTLDICYRMSQSLIDWSSEYCYGGKLKSHDLAARSNVPLRNTLKAYWKQCTPADFQGTYEQVGLDVTDIGIAMQKGNNSTSRFNVQEAYYIAWRIKDMLGYKPPPTLGSNTTQYTRIRGSDIAVISNYTGQVAEIRRQLLETFPGQEHVPRQEILDVLPMLYTTTAIQGKEANIAFYSLVIANGHLHVDKNEPLPMGFVAGIKNFNVSITRQRVARYIFGAHQMFCQVKRSKHHVSQKYGEFFAHIDKLAADGHILALEETRAYMEGLPQPANASFRRLLQEASTFTQEPAQKQPVSNQIGLSNVSAATKTTGNQGGAPSVAPAGVKFAGKRGADGNLERQNKKNKRGGGGGGRGRGGGGRGGGGAAAAT
jgi:hypothetical protein